MCFQGFLDKLYILCLSSYCTTTQCFRKDSTSTTVAPSPLAHPTPVAAAAGHHPSASAAAAAAAAAWQTTAAYMAAAAAAAVGGGNGSHGVGGAVGAGAGAVGQVGLRLGRGPELMRRLCAINQQFATSVMEDYIRPIGEVVIAFHIHEKKCFSDYSLKLLFWVEFCISHILFLSPRRRRVTRD